MAEATTHNVHPAGAPKGNGKKPNGWKRAAEIFGLVAGVASIYSGIGFPPPLTVITSHQQPPAVVSTPTPSPTITVGTGTVQGGSGGITIGTVQGCAGALADDC